MNTTSKGLSHGFRCMLTVVGGLMSVAGPVTAADNWPQWGGPGANFRVEDAGLADQWPDDGPKKLWSRELGEGYAAISSDGTSLFTMYSIRAKDDKGKFSRDGQEVLVALDPKTGKQTWAFAYDAPWPEDLDMPFGPGPNATPVIVGDRIFSIGCTAKLHCLDKNTGKLIWAKDLGTEYDIELDAYGYSASALPYKKTIILPIGGEGKGLMAFSMADGSTVWKNQDFALTFSTPILINVNGEDQLVSFTPTEVSGLNPDNGDLLWKHPHETKYGANISSPVWCGDNIVFVSSAYGMGSRALKLTRTGDKTTVEELWYNKKLRIHHADAIAIGDYVYGSSGDFGPTFFTAINAKTGEMAWRKRGFSKATCVSAGDKMIILDEDGQLALARANPKDPEVLSKCQLLQKTAWTVPTLIGKTLYVRDRKSIMALDLG